MSDRFIKTYGVLACDEKREVIRDFRQEGETRLVLESPRGDGSAFTVVTTLDADGNYRLTVENDRKEKMREVAGNVFTEDRAQEE